MPGPIVPTPALITSIRRFLESSTPDHQASALSLALENADATAHAAWKTVGGQAPTDRLLIALKASQEALRRIGTELAGKGPPGAND